MQVAVSQDDGVKGPILVHSHPWSRDDALENMLAFSDEARLQEKLAGEPDPIYELSKMTWMPRTRKCYGCVRLSGARIFNELPSKWWPTCHTLEKKRRQLFRDMNYTALVYEYIEEGDNDRDVVAKSLDFFRDAGFSHTPTSLARNWKQSVLIDMSDIIYPGGFGWHYWELSVDHFLRPVSPATGN